MTKLNEIAYARSGDKGNDANIGVIAFTEAGFQVIRESVTEKKVEAFFRELGVTEVIRYELPNLLAFNFLLIDALGGGASRSLRVDSQGKTFGQRILEMEI